MGSVTLRFEAKGTAHLPAYPEAAGLKSIGELNDPARATEAVAHQIRRIGANAERQAFRRDKKGESLKRGNANGMVYNETQTKSETHNGG